MKLSDLPGPNPSIVVAVLLLIAGFVTTKAFALIGFFHFLIGAILITIVFVSLAAIAMAFQERRHRENVKTIVDQIRAAIPVTALPQWLLSDEVLASAELGVPEGESIWIVSPDLVNVSDKQVIRDAVEINLGKRITYTYIVPDHEEANGSAMRLREYYKKHGQLLKIVTLPAERFRLLSVTHIAIFNATMMNGKRSEVYLELPIEVSNALHGYWVKVAPKAAEGLTARFEKILREVGQSKANVSSV